MWCRPFLARQRAPRVIRDALGENARETGCDLLSLGEGCYHETYTHPSMSGTSLVRGWSAAFRTASHSSRAAL